MRWWRLFRSRKQESEAGDPPDDSGQGPRRRRAVRYDFRIKATVLCAGWSDPIDVITADVSQTGAFLCTAVPAEQGSSVRLELYFTAVQLVITGTIARQVESSRHGPGLGVHFDELDDVQSAGLTAIIEAAEGAAPKPADEVDEDGLEELFEVGDDDVLDSEETSELLDLEELPKRERSRPGTPTSPPVPPEPPPAAPAKRPTLVVGIDLGTTYTSVGAVVGSKVVILPRDSGRKSTPSVLTFEDQDTIIIGDRDRIATDPAHTVASPKRILGRPIHEPDVERFVARAPYRTLEGPDGSVIIEMRGNHYAVPQLIGFLLEDAKKLAERHLGQRVEHAVVSVPISFDAVRVEHLKRAGRMAGLNIVAVIDEPSAAALANRYSPDFGGIVGVYDFGGGTFDFSVVDVSRGDFRVLATSGDTWLGGDDFDEVLASAAANQFWRKHQVDLRNQALEWQRLLFACEVAKRSLTTRERAAISVPEVLRTASGMVDLNFTIDRNVLARAAAPIIEQSLATCNEALHLIGLEPDQLTAVYLSGGTSYMPAVREALAEHFGVPIRTGVPPEHAVCLGAAIHAAQLQLSGGATLESR